ncbi:MAG: sugar O-acetyltransferase [Polyangiaceae bacterium]
MTELTEKQKMLAGELYVASDAALAAERRRAKVLCHRYNQTPVDLDLATLRELLQSDADPYLEPPFYCDYGYNFKVGRRVYANHNLVVLDCALVTLGDDVFMGPNVVITTATHPIDAALRTSGPELAKPIRVGNRVWLGASVTLLPGVEIGDNVTIGAGSVVSRSIPANCVAFGNPCRVQRSL